SRAIPCLRAPSLFFPYTTLFRSRSLPLGDFQVGLMETALAEDEIVLGFELPILSAQARWSYQKFNRKTGEFGHAICAAVLDAGQDRKSTRLNSSHVKISYAVFCS